jgi:hypothetical protein
MKQFFLFYTEATTFAVAQEDRLKLIDFNKTNSESEILLINSSRNSSLTNFKQSRKSHFRGIPALDGYQVVFDGTAVFAGQKIRFIVCSNQASNVTLVLAPKNQTN